MRILLDTQVLVWALEEDNQLSERARVTILTADEVFISAISFLEIAIKLRLPKKIGANKPLAVTMEAARLSDYNWLPILPKHLIAYQQIPLFDDHRDPFDRMILAISLSEGLTVVSSDRNFARYESLVNTIW